MEVKRRTPRTEARYKALIEKMAVFFEELAEGEGEEAHVIDLALTQFAALSARIMLNGAEADFEMAEPGDSVEELKDKALAYLNSESMDVIDEAMRLVRRSAISGDPATAPEPPPEDAPKA